jgi:alginate O-acetyltransferase complex protein AlgI
MNFNSLPFVVLAIATFLAYYAPIRAGGWQVAVLVVASLVFYGWAQPYLLLLLLFSAAVTSLASFAIARAEDGVRRRLIAIAGTAAMLLVLAFFKYDRLIAETVFGNLDPAPGLAGRLLMLPLPIGISFYTFHGISLVVDTFTGQANLQRAVPARVHAARTLLYLTFFPQLIAGPIMKARDFLPQIGRKEFGAIDWTAATRALIVGYFLKMVVADNLAGLTGLTTGSVNTLAAGSITLLTLVFAYSCQIFADFAGYSLIAIGLARLFGYALMTNFNFPYLAQSFSEFWHRWHISLSTWLRDYLYIPLGGSRCGWLRRSLNIMIVMFLGGLWHGAAWNYAIWGSLHGLALAIERPFLRARFYTNAAAPLRVLRTAMVVLFVSFAWLLFRLPDFSQVIAFMTALFANRHVFNGGETVIALIVYSLPVAIYHLVQLVRQPAGQPARSWVYATLAAAICLNSGVPGAFIYFQF